MLAFPTDLAPIVGQQITLTATNGPPSSPRIDLLIARAGASFTSLILGGAVTECDLIVKGSVGGAPRGWKRLLVGPVPGRPRRHDRRRVAARARRRPRVRSPTPARRPGSGTRMGIDRDEDTVLDGLDNCPAVDNLDQLDTDADLAGNVCDADDDGDGLLDAVETDTGIFVGPGRHRHRPAARRHRRRRLRRRRRSRSQAPIRPIRTRSRPRRSRRYPCLASRCSWWRSVQFPAGSSGGLTGALLA